MGNICALSVQKFSSNVIEKCIRVAEHNTRKALIEELLNRSRLEKLLRDSFGNYCVQTALDYAEPGQRALVSSQLLDQRGNMLNSCVARRRYSSYLAPHPQHPVRQKNPEQTPARADGPRQLALPECPPTPSLLEHGAEQSAWCWAWSDYPGSCQRIQPFATLWPLPWHARLAHRYPLSRSARTVQYTFACWAE
jgi:hypothetical protein